MEQEQHLNRSNCISLDTNMPLKCEVFCLNVLAGYTYLTMKRIITEERGNSLCLKFAIDKAF